MINAKALLDGISNPQTREKHIEILKTLNPSNYQEAIDFIKKEKGLTWLSNLINGPVTYSPQKVQISPSIKPKTIKPPEPPKIEVKIVKQLHPVLAKLKEKVLKAEKIDKAIILDMIDGI